MADQPGQGQPGQDQPGQDRGTPARPRVDQEAQSRVGPDLPADPAELAGLYELAAVMRTLRAECPWKAAQTHESLVPYLREEAEEAVEAIQDGDPEWLQDEFGDVLLQVYFHAVLAEEAGHFTLDDVARGITAKMRRRNPHVYGDVVATTPEQATAAWEAAKRAEG